jgi:hypothetical protein
MKVENIKRAIEKLEAINPNDEFAYEKAVMAYLQVQRLPVLIYEVPDDLRICRTRTHEAQNFFEDIGDISTPPLKFVTKFARCNRPFQPKFYGSENRPTSFMELVEDWAETRTIGDKIYVTVGLWKTRKPLFALIVTSPNKENRTSEFDKKHGGALDDFVGKQENEAQDAMVLFYQFLFDKFRKPAKHDPLTYIITTAYCNVAFAQAGGQANSVMYPSVPFGGQGVNFALNPDFITPENIELVNVICNEITVSENKQLKFNYTETNIWTAKEVKPTLQKLIW